jgi:pyruvate dehydrogenase E2 component (dihydrolipoamide acetyltransferase)
MLNASFADTSVQVHNRINIGIAIALENGLIAPCIFDADQKGIADIAKASASLAERARSGGLTADEMSAATFNITNLGMYGIESFSAVITPPQAAALAVGSVVREATFREDQVVAADMMRLTLSIDHRVADGAQGANFMADIRTNLENPISLFL